MDGVETDGRQALIASAGPSILGVNELESTGHAVSVRADSSGNPFFTRRPFLDTSEIVGGDYLLDAPDNDAAIRLASLIPEATAAHGGVEIRPIRRVCLTGWASTTASGLRVEWHRRRTVGA
jgi:hypothetical protein